MEVVMPGDRTLPLTSVGGHADNSLAGCVKLCVGCQTNNGTLRAVVTMNVNASTGDMTVAESHDIALALQHKVEALEDVERCALHAFAALLALETHAHVCTAMSMTAY
jgi:hypothetical protein